MRRLILAVAVWGGMASGAVVVDRLAAIAGKHAIKLSEIERDLRVTEFLNREPLNLAREARRKAAERLIDQALIRDEMAQAGFRQAGDAGAGGLVERLRRDRFSGSDERLRQALSGYGLTEDALRAHLAWESCVLQFIDQRFRPGVLVTDDEVREYYQQHRAELVRQYPRTPGLEALAPKIRESIEGERINRNFEQWLNETRQQTHIEYLQGAFQ
ncbi:MAG TPA: hypothetical protein VMH28_02490 [Candidatus Acidoferrales bacterium]|nr:hypothetical protein [Candidatus Acidoferrales bacterium]